ncbi:glycoside hydrolase family 79 protein [Mycena rebaudengoi]|nr:glycoside hydrolase family 79 protein [Mycena rebaudengoi]
MAHPRLACLGVFLLLLGGANCDITVYHANNAAAFTTVPGAKYTGPAAYNPTSLVAPPVPTPAIQTTLDVALQNSGTPGISVKQKGSFLGFSIEMSVTNQVLGKNSSLIQVPFLNLMSNIVKRAGSVMVRVGGNTQESAKIVDSLPDGRILAKDYAGAHGTTETPPLDITVDMLHLMRKISDLVPVHWFMGIPWFVTTPFNTAICKAADEIIGDYLLGMQASNEPDFYVGHKHRDAPYLPGDYVKEFSTFISQIATDGSDVNGRIKNMLIGPNIAISNDDWTLDKMWATGFIDTFAANLKYLACGEVYPRDNCAAMFGGGVGAVVPQEILPRYLTHNGHKELIDQYQASTLLAQTKGKPFLMFETNTASCGGFMGVSDSVHVRTLGTRLRSVSGPLQLHRRHVPLGWTEPDSAPVILQPFTSPPTNQTTFHQWTIGPMYYAVLAMAEVLGPTNNSQVLDLPIPGSTEFTPMYGIYENGVPVRVAIFNYVDDPSGATDVHASISINGGTLPSAVKVKYLLAKTVVQKGNITWAGQTFGGNFDSDGRLTGDEVIESVPCDQDKKVCIVRVPAPGFALVYLTDSVYSEKQDPPQTYATTARTKIHNTATIPPEVLATSNGQRQGVLELLGTSRPPKNAARHNAPLLVSVVVGAAVMGAALALGGRV